MDKRTGISNRETPDEEQLERQTHPPQPDRPEPEDAAGRRGEEPRDDVPNWHSSALKAGTRSIAQKTAGTRYPDRSTPSSHKVPGAFGREPRETEASKKDA